MMVTFCGKREKKEKKNYNIIKFVPMEHNRKNYLFKNGYWVKRFRIIPN